MTKLAAQPQAHDDTPDNPRRREAPSAAAESQAGGPPAGSQPPGGGSWRWEGGRGWVEVHPAAATHPQPPEPAEQPQE